VTEVNNYFVRVRIKQFVRVRICTENDFIKAIHGKTPLIRIIQDYCILLFFLLKPEPTKMTQVNNYSESV